ncbi:unnamed protein product [Rangifer tarandus platyrhynchus]|uniref:Uncharacterized protein n=1 Tax=Rangifer tarandus platyrhynchus TaxID=3082113 RepID=A0AC60A5E7_RANTA
MGRRYGGQGWCCRVPSPTPDFLLQGRRAGRFRALGLDKRPSEGDGGSLVLCRYVTAEPELWEGSRGIPEQVLVQEQDLQPEVCSEGGLGKPGVCGSQAVGEWGGERSPDSP